jgi:cytoskeletal protein CcmA (bactofilin family)
MLNSKDGIFGKRDDKQQPRKGVGGIYGANPGSTASTSTSSPGVSSSGYAGGMAADGTRSGTASVADGGVDMSKGNKLIVGPDIKLKGEISDCHTIIVEGKVEATTDSRVLQISESGSFSGTVGIDVAEIRGKFEGELTARQKLVVYATGSVSGKIRYGKVVIEEGGELTGDVSSLATAGQSGTVISARAKDAAQVETRSDDKWRDDKAKAASV